MSVRIINGYLHLDFRFQERRYRPATRLLPTPDNRKFCEQWDAAIRREIVLGTFVLDKHFPTYADDEESAEVPRTFKQDAEAWLEAHKETWAEWTYRKFKNNLEARIFTKPFARLVSREIKPRDLRALVSDLAKEGRRDGKKLTNRSINKLMQPVKQVLLELFSDGEIASNPIPKKLKLKERRIEEIRPFSEEELKKISKTTQTKRFRHYEPLVNYIFEELSTRGELRPALGEHRF